MYLQKLITEKQYGKMEWFAKKTAVEIREEFLHLGFLPESAIVMGMVYRSTRGEEVVQKQTKKVSRYALGEDYHRILRKKGKKIIKGLSTLFPEAKFRQSVDSLPIAEKVLAREAGIGWQGKNTNIIHPKLGSYFFISVILTDLACWEISAPIVNQMTDHCGSCRRCLDACPTQALDPYKLHIEKCISYQTIEDRSMDKLWTGQTSQKKGWIYGCDICQEVCPWNHTIATKNAVETPLAEFLPKPFWYDPTQWEKELDENAFESLFSGTSLNRITNKMWNRNLKTS